MEQIIIIRRDGSRVPLQNRGTTTRISSAKQKVELLGADTVDITVQSPFPQAYEIGDRIEIFGRRYTLNVLPKVKKESAYNFQYDLQFEGVQYDLARASYDVTIDTTGVDVQGDSLTGDLRRFMQVLIANISRIFPGKWVLGSCPDTDTKTLTFGDSDNCLSVLQNVCDEYGLEFEIIQSANGVCTINITNVGKTFPFTFKYGKGLGIYELTREKVSSSNIVTRLKCYGSTKNITSKYRCTKLCLPNKTKAQSFLEDAKAIAQYGIWENTKNFDDIYPHRTGTISALGDSVLKFSDSTMFNLNETESDGKTTKYLLNGVSAKVHFNTGNLAGYEFEIHAYDHATHTFTLKKITDNRDMSFPSETSSAFQFGIGDEYVLIDIALPQSYIDGAEKKLLEAGTKFLQQNCQPKVQYSLTLDEFFLKSIAGLGTTSNAIWVGDYIPVIDTDIDVDKSIRVKSFTRDLIDEYKYTLTIADVSVERSTYTRVISDLIDIDKILTINNLKDPAKARRDWLSAQEVLNMVFDPEGDYYTDKIKPNSVDTLMLSVGAKSMQFGLVGTVFQPNFNGNKNLMRVKGGILTHYAIEEMPRSWTLSDGDTTFLSDSQAYYIYAKVLKQGNTGTIVFTPQQIGVEEDAMNYHFWIGVVNSVDTMLHVRSVSLTYGFTTVNGRFIKTGRIQSPDGSTYFDLDAGEIGGKIVFDSNGQEKTLEELGQESLDAKNYIDNTLPGILNDLRAQLDGQIEQFFYEYDPTTSNIPAKEWTTTTLKENHLGDLFYNTETGKVFRWVKEGTVYKWKELQDSEVANALALANDALALAREKRRIFTSTPIPPYEVGDLWVQGASGDIMRCKTNRLSGSYTSSDWEKASKYTSDAALTAFINGVFANTVEDFTNQIDGKIESWFQESDPATTWTTVESQVKHVGDTWYTPTDKKLYFYVKGNVSQFKNVISKNGIHFWKKGTAPTISNAPASSWNTSTLKEAHVSDLYYNTAAKKLYIYSKKVEYDNNGNPIISYYWNEKDDENLLFVSAKVVSYLADGVTLFINTPNTYTIGDCFIQDLYIKIANTTRTTGSYNSSEWTIKTNVLYYWQRSVDQTALDAYEAASKAQDTADGKRRVFVSTPYAPYDIGDLWVNGTDLRRCQTAKVVGQSYSINDWVIAVNYDNTKTVIDGGIVTSGTVQLAGSGGSILAGITGEGTETSSVRFWAGASKENRTTAPFRVLQDGSIIASKATIEGIIKAISGSIGGFEIGQGRIGVSESSEMEGKYNGLALLSDFIKFSKTNLWAGIGANVFPASSGLMGLGRFEYSGSSYNSGIGLYTKFRPRNNSSWYTQRALQVDGNSFSIGGNAHFDDTYHGEAYTDIIEEYIGITNNFFFGSIGAAYRNVRLPGRAYMNRTVSELSGKDISFLLYIQIGWLGNSNRIKLSGCDDGVLVDNNAERINGGNGWLDMAQGDSLVLRYCNGHYYTVRYGT